MKIEKATIPKNSLVEKLLPVNYWDAYSCVVPADVDLTPDDLHIEFWTGESKPKFIERLFAIRNTMVKWVGLKGDTASKESSRLFAESIRQGTSYQMSSITAKSDEETVLCLDDSHLKAYISARIEIEENEKRIYLTTLVVFKRKLGYVYFYAIKPFHHLVVKSMFKHAVKVLCKA